MKTFKQFYTSYPMQKTYALLAESALSSRSSYAIFEDGMHDLIEEIISQTDDPDVIVKLIEADRTWGQWAQQGLSHLVGGNKPAPPAAPDPDYSARGRNYGTVDQDPMRMQQQQSTNPAADAASILTPNTPQNQQFQGILDKIGTWLANVDPNHKVVWDQGIQNILNQIQQPQTSPTTAQPASMDMSKLGTKPPAPKTGWDAIPGKKTGWDAIPTKT